MKPLSIEHTNAYASDKISILHKRKKGLLESQTLSNLLNMDFYLFKAKSILIASELINRLLDVSISLSEEKLYADFLKDLVIFVASQTCGGHKSTASGVDLEFENKGTHYIVSVKAGPNWGNSSQQSKLAEDLQKAVRRVKQSQHGKNVQPVLGICYGKT